MERTIQLQEHYGAVVWTHVEMDTARKTECLCRLCDRPVQCFSPFRNEPRPPGTGVMKYLLGLADSQT